METNTLFNTATLWAAVGTKPVDLVVPAMEKDGWTCISTSKGALKSIVLAREKQMVRLFARDERVGMVSVLRQSEQLVTPNLNTSVS